MYSEFLKRKLEFVVFVQLLNNNISIWTEYLMHINFKYQYDYISGQFNLLKEKDTNPLGILFTFAHDLWNVKFCIKFLYKFCVTWMKIIVTSLRSIILVIQCVFKYLCLTHYDCRKLKIVISWWGEQLRTVLFLGQHFLLCIMGSGDMGSSNWMW